MAFNQTRQQNPGQDAFGHFGPFLAAVVKHSEHTTSPEHTISPEKKHLEETNSNKRGRSEVSDPNGSGAAKRVRESSDLDHSPGQGSVNSKISHSMVAQSSAVLGNSSRQDRNVQNQATRRSLFNCSTITPIWMEFKDKIEGKLRDRLKVLTRNDFNNMEDGFEIVDSVHLLKLFNISNPKFDAFVQKAGDGDKQLVEGLKLAKEGYDKLKLAVSDVLGSST